MQVMHILVRSSSSYELPPFSVTMAVLGTSSLQFFFLLLVFSQFHINSAGDATVLCVVKMLDCTWLLLVKFIFLIR